MSERIAVIKCWGGELHTVRVAPGLVPAYVASKWVVDPACWVAYDAYLAEQHHV